MGAKLLGSKSGNLRRIFESLGGVDPKGREPIVYGRRKLMGREDTRTCTPSVVNESEEVSHRQYSLGKKLIAIKSPGDLAGIKPCPKN